MTPRFSETPAIWITGPAGFLGRAVCRELSKQQNHGPVCGIGRGISPDFLSPSGPLQAAEPDCITTAGLDRLSRQFGAPTMVFHLAAGASVSRSFAAADQDFRNTVASTATLLHWLGRNAPDAKLVLASSAAVYGTGHPGLIAEDAVCRPASPYGWHKKIVEDLARCEAQTSGLRVVSARIFSVYGAGLRKQLFWDLARKASTKAPELSLMGTGAELRDWCHVDDIARVLVELAGKPNVFGPDLKSVNIGSGRAVSVGEASRTFLHALLNRAPNCPKIRFSGLRPPGDPQALVSNTLALASLGICPPRAFPHELEETAHWYRKEFGFDQRRVHFATGTEMDGRADLHIQPRLGVS